MVRTLSNIYDGAFCKISENLSTVFTKNPISDVWRVPKHASASKRFLKLIYNIWCYLILKLRFLRKAKFSEYQEMAAPTVLFIKVNYAFTKQNFKPSLLINKIIVKTWKETVSFRFLTRNYRVEKTYNYGTRVCRQIHEIKENRFFYGMFCSCFFVVSVRKLHHEFEGESGISLRLPSFRRSESLSCSGTREATPTLFFLW